MSPKPYQAAVASRPTGLLGEIQRMAQKRERDGEKQLKQLEEYDKRALPEDALPLCHRRTAAYHMSFASREFTKVTYGARQPNMKTTLKG